MPYPVSGADTACGGRLGGVMRADHGLREYRCSNAEWPADGSPRCDCAPINADWLDGTVWDVVVDVLFDPHRLMEVASDSLGSRGDAAEPEAEALGDLDQQIAKLEQARVDQAAEAPRAPVPGEVLAAAVAQIDRELVALRARRDSVLSWRAGHRAEQQPVSDSPTLTQARDWLPSMPLTEQVEVLRLLRVSVRLLDGSGEPALIVRGLMPGGGPLVPRRQPW